MEPSSVILALYILVTSVALLGCFASHSVKVAQNVAQGQFLSLPYPSDVVFMSFGGVVQWQRQAT